MSSLAAGLMCSAALAAVTPGWENVNPSRVEHPTGLELWKADFSRKDSFSFELREGADAVVTVTKGGVRIVKRNRDGYVVVKAKPFRTDKGRKLRLFADLEIPDGDVDYSSGFLRAHGEKEHLGLSPLEGFNFWGGGHHTMRGMPNTAPGMTTRKFAQFIADEGIVTPVIVVGGAPSTSVWRNWTVEDHLDAEVKWKKFRRQFGAVDHEHHRIDEKDFDRILASDVDHVAKIQRIDGVSRLVVDGKIAAPVVFKSHHRRKTGPGFESFAGYGLDGSDVRLMIKNVQLGADGTRHGFWTPSGFDATGAVAEVKRAMRMAPDSLFLIAIGCAAYPEFTEKEHPGERWIRKDGTPVMGTMNSCIIGYQLEKNSDCWPWVSYSSRIWREKVKGCIRELVAELKRQGLSKRIVGTHIYGYHDSQFSMPYADYSEAAKRECARIAKRAVSKDYDFLCKQTGFTAQEEFVREFKQALGKDSIGVIWCESPYNGAINASIFLNEFVRSDAVDVIVAQPHYRERRPAFPITCVIPTDSLHLHGKMFWNEFDLRTYGSINPGWAGNSAVSAMGVGMSHDFEMWQTVFRKHAGEMSALRMGYWMFDLESGWFAPPEISADIRRVAREERFLAEAPPSPWRPEVAVVVDEEQFFRCKDGNRNIAPTDDFIYAQQFRYFVTGGAPFLRYLSEDVMENPSLLDGCKMVVFAFMRNVDGRREKLLRRLGKGGRTLVFLSETGVSGGASAIGFRPKRIVGHFEHLIVPEHGFTDNVMSEIDVWQFRINPKNRTRGSRVTVAEDKDVRVLARYASDRLPALAVREDPDCRRVYVCEPGGFTPALFNRFAREAGAYVALDRPGVQLNMNGDFISLHCLRGGKYSFRLPFDCDVMNMRTGKQERVSGNRMLLEMTAGQTCRFRLHSK